MELVIVDDCSKDKSIEEVEKLDDSRVTLIKLHQNYGANYASNIGIKESLGDIIAFQDSDDLWREGKLLAEIIKMIEEKADLGIKKVVIFREEGWINIKDLLYVNIISTQTIVSKREVFEHNKFKLNLSRFQDWEFALRISDKYNFFYLSDVLVD
ncbi:glycosyltransferase [Pseudolactococcus piscium]|nr:glycosyltransferase [Lactococcus piscium]